MKLMFCGACVEIKSMDPDGAPTTCKCGNMTARWLDPQRGTVRVKAIDRTKVRFIGMNNSFLLETFRGDFSLADKQWRDLHDATCTNASGYLFHSNIRNCWACIVRVGDSNDIAWEESIGAETA